MEIKNLKKVAQRIFKAVNKKEKIILYGDADLDGTASVIILKETLKNLAGNIVAIYFPDREKEGYGINKKALSFLKKFAPAILITLDCGIGNFEEVRLAKKLGLEVIIIDHHEILDKLPVASIIVDPKQKGDKYPFKVLANVAITYKLSKILLKKNLTDSMKRNFLELVALATIADKMPEENENKTIIEEGLSSIENSWRPGIQAFFKKNFLKNYFNLREKVSKIISILNVRDAHPVRDQRVFKKTQRKQISNGAQNNYPANFRLLTTPSLKEAEALVDNLLEKSILRRKRINEMVEKVEEKISKKLVDSIVFDGEPSWEVTLLSPIASMICYKYKKPAFIFKKLKTESLGTVRTPPGINSISLMKKCSKYLITYGGHPSASGFRIKNKNLEKFKHCLLKNL